MPRKRPRPVAAAPNTRRPARRNDLNARTARHAGRGRARAAPARRRRFPARRAAAFTAGSRRDQEPPRAAPASLRRSDDAGRRRGNRNRRARRPRPHARHSLAPGGETTERITCAADPDRQRSNGKAAQPQLRWQRLAAAGAETERGRGSRQPRATAVGARGARSGAGDPRRDIGSTRAMPGAVAIARRMGASRSSTVYPCYPRGPRANFWRCGRLDRGVFPRSTNTIAANGAPAAADNVIAQQDRVPLDRPPQVVRASGPAARRTR